MTGIRSRAWGLSWVSFDLPASPWRGCQEARGLLRPVFPSLHEESLFPMKHKQMACIFACVKCVLMGSNEVQMRKSWAQQHVSRYLVIQWVVQHIDARFAHNIVLLAVIGLIFERRASGKGTLTTCIVQAIHCRDSVCGACSSQHVHRIATQPLSVHVHIQHHRKATSRGQVAVYRNCMSGMWRCSATTADEGCVQMQTRLQLNPAPQHSCVRGCSSCCPASQ